MVFLQLTVLSHCLTDFIFQSSLVTAQRRSKNLRQRLKANLLHSSSVALLLFFILILWYKPSTVLPFTFCIWLAHFIIDFTKSSLMVKSKPSKEDSNKRKGNSNYLLEIYSTFITRWKDTLLFITDQILHLLVILLLWHLIDIESGGLFHALNFSNWKLKILLIKFNRPLIINLLNYLIVYTITCFGGRFAINCIIEALKLNSKMAHMNQKTIRFIEPSPISGDYIGIFERFIRLTLVISEAYSAISFVFTAKSLARFRELDNRDFVEYYLIGTLMSTVLGISGGLLLKLLIL